MTNADKFKAVFGIYSEEFWASQIQDAKFWLNWLRKEIDNELGKET